MPCSLSTQGLVPRPEATEVADAMIEAVLRTLASKTARTLSKCSW
jgi:hypothetical protein